MKIQVISYDKKIKYGTEHEYTYSSLNSPMALDMFDINIISLQTAELWAHDDTNNCSIDSLYDFMSLKELIGSVKKSKVVICFPQNYSFKYSYYAGRYHHACQLKDMLPNLNQILESLIPYGIRYETVYENSETVCYSAKYTAAFYFSHVIDDTRMLTRCIGADHCTTCCVNSNLIFTTLDISKQGIDINPFLKSIGLIEQKSELPTWVREVEFLDDKAQEETVKNAKDEIEKQKKKIENARNIIEENLRYKSILCETGDALVEVVLDMLGKMLDYDLSSFEDKHKEDFLIKKDCVTFVGEIKGVTSNVRSSNISQTETHAREYAEQLADTEEPEESIKPILIINPLRTTPINERKLINEDQRHMAEARGILVITTEVLLAMFERFLNNSVSKKTILDLLANKVGVLDKNDF